jgi:hypothetical protein
MEGAPPPDVAALSVVCELNGPFGLLREKTLTEACPPSRTASFSRWARLPQLLALFTNLTTLDQSYNS